MIFEVKRVKNYLLKAKKLIKSLSKEAAMILRYGLMLSLGLLIIGIFAFCANKAHWNSYINAVWSIKIVVSAQSLFVQSFLGALIFECVRLCSKM